jgi:hypothetical protein
VSCSYASARLGHSLNAVFHVVDFWVTIPCSLVHGYRRLGGRWTQTTQRFHNPHQDVKLHDDDDDDDDYYYYYY